ncbi:PadR family transcriptional regulator [Phaeacidiphilus oryzae]|uniref:PadR family transcriptional regulator n=1 Tax=Phaeacidiphilus oryzae TaxID=348818 RepID=UPI000689708D|nr:PadR family transcriptional regulator [Phaeacidiphilus oryzae]
MSIRHGLLALLDQGPRYGYQLRAEFESRTGGTWPLNVGQVYTTLGRLERDGLVAPCAEGAGAEEAEGQVYYAITEQGRQELRSWFGTPVGRNHPPRDELAIKLAMAVGAPEVDVQAVVQAQRAHTMRALQDYTRLKARALAAETGAAADPGGSREAADSTDDLAWLLVLEQLIFQAEAEIRWLDHCEQRLARAGRARRQQAAKAAGTADTADTADGADARAGSAGTDATGAREQSATRDTAHF